MPDWIQAIDTWMFYAINHGWSNSFFDWLMPFITERKNWFPVWIAVILSLVIYFWRSKRPWGFFSLLLITLIITASDQISSSVIKPAAERIRPSNALTDVHLLVKRTKSYSFPSSHAANFFAAATFFAWLIPRWASVYFFIAVLVSLSRTYVGVHYPFDLVGGAIAGSLTALFVIFIYQWMEQRFKWPSIRILQRNPHV